MVDEQIINEMIEDFESDGLTLGNCNELASLYIIRNELDKQGLIEETPNSNLESLQSLIEKYIMDRDVVSLNILLTKMGEVLSELYHTCDTEEEKLEFSEFIKNAQNIITPTIL